jgi:hypothetical protein
MVIAKFLQDHKSTLVFDDVVMGDDREPQLGRTGIVVGNPAANGTTGGAQLYMANLIIYCPDTMTNIQTTKDGVAKAFALAGRVDQLFESHDDAVLIDGVYLVNPHCGTPVEGLDPLTNLAVVTMTVDYGLMQGVS